ncbi:MAG: hypothetical protein V4495_21910 [Pseudomonadota bacterium]
MGLLDLFGSDIDDPKTQNMFGIASGLMSAGGPSRTPVSFGQALASGLQAGQNAASNATNKKMQEERLRRKTEGKLAFNPGYLGFDFRPQPRVNFGENIYFASDPSGVNTGSVLPDIGDASYQSGTGFAPRLISVPTITPANWPGRPNMIFR